MNCKNCLATHNGNYCPNCGQNAHVHPINIKHVLHDFAHAFTHTDKGFALLIKELLVRPGIVTREYLEGKRKKYFNPLSFFVITSAVSAYVTGITGYFDALARGGSDERMHPLWQEAFIISNNNTKLFSLLLIAPLITFFCWLFFRKPRHNLAEHFVLHSFVIGQSHIFRIVVFVPLFLIFPFLAQQLLWLFEVTLFVYLVIAYRQFFRQHIAWTILKTLLIFPCFIVLYWMLIFLFVYVRNLIA